MSSGDDDDLDCTFGGPVSDELVAKTESAQQSGSSQNLLGVLPARKNDAGSAGSCHPAKAWLGNFLEEAFARGLVYLSLTRYLGQTHALLVTWKTLTSSLYTLIYLLIYTCENLYPRKLSIAWRRFPQNAKIQHHENSYPYTVAKKAGTMRNETVV